MFSIILNRILFISKSCISFSMYTCKYFSFYLKTFSIIHTYNYSQVIADNEIFKLHTEIVFYDIILQTRFYWLYWIDQFLFFTRKIFYYYPLFYYIHVKYPLCYYKYFNIIFYFCHRNGTKIHFNWLHIIFLNHRSIITVIIKYIKL